MAEDNTLLCNITLGELKKVLREFSEKHSPRNNNSPQYVYGLKGICDLFNVKMSTAQKYKNGILKDAIIQQNRKIIIDVRKAIELYEEHKTNK